MAERILVIEDDPDLNRQLATALTDAGYVVDRAFDGEEGHYLGETEPYDAVILDMMLPKLDGWDLLETLRETHKTPVLILSARDALSDRVLVLFEGRVVGEYARGEATETEIGLKMGGGDAARETANNTRETSRNTQMMLRFLQDIARNVNNPMPMFGP